MKNLGLKLFFDESGKRNNTPTIMGGFSVPTTLYETQPFQQLTEKLQNTDMKLHWNEYSGFEPMKKDICDVINTIMPYWRMFKFNVINYYTPNRPVYNGQLFTKMIYIINYQKEYCMGYYVATVRTFLLRQMYI